MEGEESSSYLIGLLGTHSKTLNVLMRIIFVFSLPPRSFREALRPRNSSTLNTKNFEMAERILQDIAEQKKASSNSTNQ